jgi:putative hydrolase of the HAD superfamily
MLKAVLFDLDDTLIDWGDFFEDWDDIEEPHLRNIHKYLTENFPTPPTFEVYREAFSTRTRRTWSDARTSLIAPHLGKILLEAAVEVGLPQADLDIEAFLDAYKWSKIPGTVVFPDVPEGLANLRDRGLRFGMVTNAFQPMRLRDVELQEHGLLKFFPECRFSAADVGHLKPHHLIFERALECLGTSPEETVFVGDNPTADIAGAQSAGMRAILRVTARRRPMLSGVIVPDAAINSLEEMPAIFDLWFPGWGEQQT